MVMSKDVCWCEWLFEWCEGFLKSKSDKYVEVRVECIDDMRIGRIEGSCVDNVYEDKGGGEDEENSFNVV